MVLCFATKQAENGWTNSQYILKQMQYATELAIYHLQEFNSTPKYVFGKKKLGVQQISSELSKHPRLVNLHATPHILSVSFYAPYLQVSTYFFSTTCGSLWFWFFYEPIIGNGWRKTKKIGPYWVLILATWNNQWSAKCVFIALGDALRPILVGFHVPVSKTHVGNSVNKFHPHQTHFISWNFYHLS